MKTAKEKRFIKEEISQATVRLLLIVFIQILAVVVYIFDAFSITNFLIIVGYALFSVFWWLFVKIVAGDYPSRRRFIALSDLFIISISMHYANDYGAIFFFIYLWVIVGNGMRFGSRALIESTLFGFSFFIIMVTNTQYWITNPHISFGMLIGLVLLPSYYLILIKRLSRVSNQLEEELARTTYSATHDAMSGLSNRAYFFQRLEDKIKEVRRNKESFIVMYLDLDDFKQINDTWGHHFGDSVIKEIARRIKSQAREGDLVARLGGDEFALVLHSAAASINLSRFTQRLINSITEPVIIGSNKVQVTVSIGISMFPDNGSSAQELVNSADHSMYVSKKSGRNRFTLSSVTPQPSQ